MSSVEVTGHAIAVINHVRMLPGGVWSAQVVTLAPGELQVNTVRYIVPHNAHDVHSLFVVQTSIVISEVLHACLI